MAETGEEELVEEEVIVRWYQGEGTQPGEPASGPDGYALKFTPRQLEGKKLIVLKKAREGKKPELSFLAIRGQDPEHVLVGRVLRDSEEVQKAKEEQVLVKNFP
jgi:hypothetical protein